MKMAETWATRGTCNRLQVGAVISKEGRVVSSGYNGNASSLAHCNHQKESPCETAAHAEENAIAFAAKSGNATLGCTIWCTHQPCYRCSRLIINSGIVQVVYKVDYRDPSGVDLLRAANILVRKHK